ncbi:putative sugar nucleotidyl transferase [Pedobacter gandavensis]|uniref:Glucose-1-phosphate thymidylyltransferase n=1 Tax=Pedobacter gandavensis TaxID=2679963 RepID=A0ABR6F3K1_9SPHI|nr:putative sugar nucleotidyl transferase [Pedobacter gandavensis]MBB2151288.1 glucose-1-phosphate thymidylyltransferase [Pedobacter gandavensis]
MTINLFDDNAWASLRPLSFTRPVADLRVGILTIAQKWERHLNATAGFLTIPYLSIKYPLQPGADLSINGSVCPDEGLLEAIDRLREGEALKQGDLLIAYRATADTLPEAATAFKPIAYEAELVRIFYPEDIFKNNDVELRKDFSLLTKGRSSAILSSTNVILGDEVFVEEGGGAECATLNSLSGPIYIGKNSQIWEGAHIRGSFALCHDSQVKMGAKIYGQTTIGPLSRVGGEINNAVIWGYSSKGHEGYLGNSVMGQWCNIGADTNNSNLKNNYADVKIWDYAMAGLRETGMLFCGMIMADHAKCGINTMFNTGSVVGVGANIFGAGFPKTFLPDFSWGGAQGFETYRLDKMFETAEQVFKRRNLPFDEVERNILTAVFELTKSYRS